VSGYRTDRHRNPTAFTVDLARQAGLAEGVDFEAGDEFRSGGRTYRTARLLGDPLALTLKVIDRLGFYTKTGRLRWSYIAIPQRLWETFGERQRKITVAWMYSMEGGTEMKELFE